MFNRLLVSIELSRPHNMLVAAFGALAGFFISGGREWAEVWPTAVFTGLVTGAGNIINDYYDVQIDRVNKPRRPLPSGRMSTRTAMALYITSTVLAAAGAFALLPIQVAVLVVVWQGGLYVYARWAKRVFVWGNLLVASIASSAFLAGGLVTGAVAAVAVPIAIAFVFVLSRELVKGAEDVEGDLTAGVDTAAVVVGMDRTIVWAASLMLCLAALIPLPAMAGYYGAYYLVVMEAGVVPGLLAAAWMIVKHPGKRTFGRVSWILKIEMFFGVLAVGLGNL
jgi:geranylgeranylglycerol-phosphate geranylgeranyltransferase